MAKKATDASSGDGPLPEDEPADQPVPIDTPEKSGFLGQVAEGLYDAAVDTIAGNMKLAADSVQAISDSLTTKEGAEAAVETAKSLGKDILSLSPVVPVVPPKMRQDAARRVKDWLVEQAKGFEREREEAAEKGEQVKFFSKKFGWLVIGLIAKKVAPKLFSRCPREHAPKPTPGERAPKPAPDKLPHYYDPKTKSYPNSPYKDKTRHPSVIQAELERQLEAEEKAARASNEVGKQNAEIERIHKQYIETGKWEHEGLDDWSGPDEGLKAKRKKYLEEHPEQPAPETGEPTSESSKGQ